MLETRDRDQVARVVGQLIIHERMDDEAAGRPEHQNMIVICAEVSLDGNDAVAARLIFDHYRLAPFGLQLFGKQSSADIRARARTKRHDELHCPRRPVLRLRGQHEYR